MFFNILIVVPFAVKQVAYLRHAMDLITHFSTKRCMPNGMRNQGKEFLCELCVFFAFSAVKKTVFIYRICVTCVLKRHFPLV